jgi:hypothetical protein
MNEKLIYAIGCIGLGLIGGAVILWTEGDIWGVAIC